jgi:hypothetical protein
MQATGEILDIWNICNLTINQTGVSSIYTNINLHSLPNNDKLSDILNECCKTNENLYKKRKLLNAKKVKLAQLNKLNLNEDTLKYIVDFSEEFSDLFLKNIKYKLMSHVSFILSQLKIENEFDKMWYPINTIDYQWAFDTLHKINELEQGFNIIKCRYINN